MSLGPLVFSIHGIRTRGAWQKQLTDALGDAGFRNYPLDYGFFRALQLVSPSARRRQVDWFRDLYAQRVKTEQEMPSVIAHSFGTYIVTEAMRMYPDVKFRTVILCGSIVRQDFPWSELVARQQVDRILNDCGRRDFWAASVQWGVEDAGPSGSLGFSDTAGGHVVQRFNPDWRHSDFFFDFNYRKGWIPFLTEGLVPAGGIERPHRSNWRYRTVAGIATLALIFALISVGALLLHRPDPSRGRMTAVAEGFSRLTGISTQQDAGQWLGFSLWRMRLAEGTAGVRVRGLKHREDPQGTREWTPERLTIAQPVSEGDQLRVSIEAMQRGFVYVIDRDIYADGTRGTPTLIFPTKRIRNGDNAIDPGHPIEIPAFEDKPPCFTVERTRPDQTGILLTILFAYTPIQGLQAAGSEQQLRPDDVARWESEWGKGVQSAENAALAGMVYSARENAAARGSGTLTGADPLPVNLFRRAEPSQSPLAVSALIRLTPRR